MKKLLIIGGVAAGATAAARARRLDPKMDITILERGADVSFANCGLPYYIGGDIESRSSLILQSPESFYDQYKVKVKTNTEALAIDRTKKEVETKNLETGEISLFPYDKLILAQGGRPLIPPIDGAKKEHVFSLWTLDDMDKIDSFIKTKSPKSAVVVGAGFIGLEMVEALRLRGLHVSVVEKAAHVMPHLEAEIAGNLEIELLSYGVKTYTKQALTKIEDRRVYLENGAYLDADMVIMSVGVKPTLGLAQAAGLAIGEAGGVLVNQYLETSDSDIYAAGDMVEITETVAGQKVRIPLAGPANRQGRIAASNIFGNKLVYKGSQGTSVLRLFDQVAASTGLSEGQLRARGVDFHSVVIHKENKTGYFPGSTLLTIHLRYEEKSGRILGASATGKEGVDKRIDVLATAIKAGMSVYDIAELDLAYAPPFGTPNDPVNILGFVAQNRMSGYSPSVTATELDAFMKEREAIIIDLRDPFSYQKGHVQGAYNIQANELQEKLITVAREQVILVYDETGKKAHRVLRQLRGDGFTNVYNMSGGFMSMERFERAVGFKTLRLMLPRIDEKSLDSKKEVKHNQEDIETLTKKVAPDNSGMLIIDVRSPGEFVAGAHPDAVNIPLDFLAQKVEELGNRDREIVLYCASGARSGYAARILAKLGFTNVTNAGSLSDMMAYAK